MSSQALPIIVIGAGGFGTSVAFHLLERGHQVVLVDRRQPASQTSPRAAGIGMHAHANESASVLGTASITKLENFEAETGEPLKIWKSGSLKVAYDERLAGHVRREVETLRAVGREARLVDADEATAMAPFLTVPGAAAIGYSAEDLQFEPAALPRAYLNAARKRGVVVEADTEVTGIRRVADGHFEVLTSTRTLRGSRVVLAAGGWTPRLIAALGAFVPAVTVRHQLYVTAPIPNMDESQPTVRVIDYNAYARPYQGGLMFGAYEPDPLFIDMNAVPPEYDISAVPADRARLERSAADVTPSIPALATAPIKEIRAGLPTMTTDGRYIIDELPEHPGIWVITGCCVTGLHTSPVIGELVSEWITTGRRPALLAPFSLARFDNSLRSHERLLAVTREAYEHKYQTFEEHVA